MSIRKISSLILSCVMAGVIFTGCGEEKVSVPKAQTGIITKLNESEQVFNEHSAKLESTVKIPNVNLLHNYKYYPSLASMLTALESKSIAEVCTYRSVANYIVSQNPKLEILPHSIGMTDNFCFIVRKEDTALLNDLNTAIKTMKDADTINYIIKSYILYLNPNDKVPTTDMPQIDSTETIKVGVTGDLPPLDLINENGAPAGFNTRILEEISRHINRNIEIIKISGNERATALTSKRIDVAFWATVPSQNLNQVGSVPKNVDVPNELTVTSPYYEDEIVHITLKSR